MHANVYMCLCVCVCPERQREKERERERERERESVQNDVVCVHTFVDIHESFFVPTITTGGQCFYETVTMS